ncbi:MAG: cupin domain-containing protein [Synergistaceae bacterium]|nr:cupin domain-containing protein [Synergistaceae bacterium]
MVLKNSSEPVRRNKLGGCGLGEADTFPVSIPDQNGIFIMATRLELDPGASVSYHKHDGTEEVYFIMSGIGLYTEEGEDFIASPGDVFLCRLGKSHSILNTGKEKLVLGAAIAKKEMESD